MKTIIYVILTLFAAASAQAASVCFQKRDVLGFDGKSSTELTISTTGRHEYKLTTMLCTSLPFAETIRFRTWPTSASQVCSGDDVIVMDGLSRRPADRCAIVSIEQVK